MLKSPEIEKVRKVLSFDDKMEIKSEKKLTTDIIKESAVSSEDKNREIRMTRGKSKKVSLDVVKLEFGLKDCSVRLSRSEVDHFFLDQFVLTHPEFKRSDCSVKIEDIQQDPKWGSKVREFLGIAPEVFNEKSSDRLELDINKNLSPRSSLVSTLGEPVSCSTPTKSFNPTFKPENLTNLVTTTSKQIDVDPGKEPFDLTTMKRRADEGAYKNILDFHLDIKRLRESAKIGGPAKKSILAKFTSTYEEAMTEACPWFDQKNPAAFFEAKLLEDGEVVAPPNLDHVYSTSGKVEKNRESNLVSFWRTKYQKDEDQRACVLCDKVGDSAHEGAGRLLYFRQNDWVHVSCALWSSEVYEEVDGSLQNVCQAVNRGSKLVCTFCDEKGATVGCCHATCSTNYHFQCGLSDGAAYKEDKKVYCPKHKSSYKNLPNATDFRVPRTVHLELESRKKQKWIDLRTVRVYIGSLQIEQLGYLHPKASDSKDNLVPVGFSCSRFYWSTRDPTRIVRYNCRTKLVSRDEEEEEMLSDESHLVIDHSRTKKDTIESQLTEFQRKCRLIELRRAKKILRQSKILPPVLVSSLFKHLRYRDLHPELLETQIAETPKKAEQKEATTSTKSKSEFASKSSTKKRSSPCKTSPTKRCNKAVGNIFQRTPTKSQIDSESDLLTLGDDIAKLGDIDDVRDLVSSILSDESFIKSELTDPSAAKEDPDVCVMKTWFNQLKKKKFSEVMLQCNLPFEKTNQEMDMEMDVRDKFDCVTEEFVVQQKEEDLSDLIDLPEDETCGEDLLNFVADKMDETNNEDAEGELTEVAFINKILSMSSPDFDDEKENSSSRMPFRDFSSPLRPHDDVAVKSAILQLDGSDDLEDDGRGPPPPKVRKIESNPMMGQDPESPRKDFSIAGLLSPPEQMSLSRSQTPSQQLQMSNPGPVTPKPTQMTSMATNPSLMSHHSQMSNQVSSIAGIKIPTMSGMGLADNRSSPQIPFGNVTTSGQPSVFIQHLSTPELATSFAENFQQATGRSLQYVTSVTNFQDLTSFPTFQQHTLQLNSPAATTMFQQIAPSYQNYYAPAPQISYISPGGILVSPQNIINFAPGPGTPGSLHASQILFNPSSYATYTPGGATSTSQFLQPHPPPPRMYPTPIMLAPSTSAYAGSMNAMSLNRLPSSSAVSAPQKKVARVQPQPWSKKSEKTSSSSSSPGSSQPGPRRLDPIKALSNMASHPMMANIKSPDLSPNRLSIIHGSDHFSRERNQQSLNEASSSDNDVIFVSQTNKPLKSSSESTSSLKDYRKSKADLEKQRSVGTQAKLGGPLKIMTPRPWKGIDESDGYSRRIPLPMGSGTLSSGVSVQSSADNSLAGSRPSSNISSAEAAPKVATPDGFVEEIRTTTTLSNGIKYTKQKSDSNSIKIVMQRETEKDAFRIQEMVIKEPGSGYSVAGIDPQTALQALKIKAKVGRRARAKRDAAAAMLVPLDGDGQIHHTQDQFLNEQEIVQEGVSVKKEQDDYSDVKIPPPPIWRPMDASVKKEDEAEDDSGHGIVYEMTSEDGFKAESGDLALLWRQVFEAVQEARLQHGLDLNPVNPMDRTGQQMVGLAHSALSFLLEQLPGAKSTEKYQFKYHRVRDEGRDEAPLKPNESGCARSEMYKGRKPFDMFSWLASKYRPIPRLKVAGNGSNGQPEVKLQQLSNRRITQLDLPMAMRFRHLAKSAKEAVDVFQSAIHGRGLYCKREIQSGEMVIEYAGEEIRAVLTDKREKYYESRGIGCYMFKVDDDTVVDATMKGNAARFINHSCDPNCYSKIVDVLGKKHIIIFALRKIEIGEELTYDYKFPFEDVKIPCRCSARKCRKYMN